MKMNIHCDPFFQLMVIHLSPTCLTSVQLLQYIFLVLTDDPQTLSWFYVWLAKCDARLCKTTADALPNSWMMYRRWQSRLLYRKGIPNRNGPDSNRFFEYEAGYFLVYGIWNYVGLLYLHKHYAKRVVLIVINEQQKWIALYLSWHVCYLHMAIQYLSDLQLMTTFTHWPHYRPNAYTFLQIQFRKLTI